MTGGNRARIRSFSAEPADPLEMVDDVRKLRGRMPKENPWNVSLEMTFASEADAKEFLTRVKRIVEEHG